ncbi:MAG: M48 family metallopeptidase [Candidatus Anstonellales archaeon]
MLYSTLVRDVKYPRLEFKTGNLVLVVPKNYGDKDELVLRHKKWIQHKHDSISSAMKIVADKKLGEPRQKSDFEAIVKEKVDACCDALGTTVNKIYMRKMRTKWGSCSHQNNLTLNSLLAYLPEHLIEYVIFHEVAHTKEKKHADNFWKLVESKFDDHEKREMELFGYWFLIQKEMKNEVLA